MIAGFAPELSFKRMKLTCWLVAMLRRRRASRCEVENA